MKSRLLGSVMALTIFASANTFAGSLTTLYARNNGGSNGGAVYFDVIVGANPITITGLDTNTVDTVALTLDVYTRAGTFAGSETNAALWALQASGTGTGAGANLPTAIALNSTIDLAANSTYGFALVIGPTAGHDYTFNIPTLVYSNADLTISTGSATNDPFTAPVFSPRVWNGTLYYDVRVDGIPEPATAGLCGIALALAGLVRYRARTSRSA